MPFDKAKAPFSLPKLPYADDALAPVVSANTISFHHGKHHATYIKVLNELIAGSTREKKVVKVQTDDFTASFRK